MSGTDKVPVFQGKPKTAPQRVNPFVSLHDEIDRLFGDFTRGFPDFGNDLSPSGFAPKMDVADTDTEIEMTFEMPGLTEKDIEINLSDNVLTVRGEKKSEHEEEDEKRDYRLIERSYGAFSRSIELPPGVDPEAIDARVAKGVLTVKVPKPEPVKTRKIGVKAA